MKKLDLDMSETAPVLKRIQKHLTSIKDKDQIAFVQEEVGHYDATPEVDPLDKF